MTDGFSIYSGATNLVEQLSLLRMLLCQSYTVIGSNPIGAGSIGGAVYSFLLLEVGNPVITI